MSAQHKLTNVRPPRVQITYDLEVGDVLETRELPFVVGVLADLGITTAPLKERHFINIDKDNFKDVMTALNPALRISVPNQLGDEGTNLIIQLSFKNMEDFEPLQIVQQVPALARLYEARCRLKDLLTKLDSNDILRTLLQEVIENTENREALAQDLENA